jgi:polyphenol oxidase
LLPAALTSPLLARAGFRHAFFTRHGGVSQAPFASLNFAWSGGDSRQNVLENLGVAARHLGLPASKIFYLSQVHKAGCRTVSAADDWEKTLHDEGDVVLSDDPRVACGVRAADCVPILLADEVSGAACAIHSGWRGAELDVSGEAVRALLALPAAQRAQGEHRLIAAIGPHISAAAFEVGEEVAERLELAGKVAGATGVALRVAGERPHVDLARLVEAQLRRAGVAEIDHVRGCTVGEPELYFSFRREGPTSGRHLAAIAPRGNAL